MKKCFRAFSKASDRNENGFEGCLKIYNFTPEQERHCGRSQTIQNPVKKALA